MDRAAAWIRDSPRPLIFAGGWVRYSEAAEALRAFAERTGVPVAETRAGKRTLDYNDPLSLGVAGTRAEGMTFYIRQKVVRARRPEPATSTVQSKRPGDTMITRPLRIGVVGCGNIGAGSHLPTWLAHPELALPARSSIHRGALYSAATR
ncbi:hypothetical protein [Amycolatopsis alkalitolerans]|uniref:Thiamine pyrophosphate enzyme central domain-containing protein n=1 Tax=Amycolatopsis alkalitolerans TaxID=2547244 RepID=A0A5C4LYS1_9PSEU|nr:hypothetical protein [Amycolatopsis alkalitolerans]TNC22263.1 hypothetical protein FG385_26180 [Amycolatopsis alkalitolerans]